MDSFLKHLRLFSLLIFVVLEVQNVAVAQQASRTIVAEVVAIDQPLIYNRLGAAIPGGMIFALKKDVQAIDSNKPIGPGNAQLVPWKRPRPIVLRANVGDILEIKFTNWMTDWDAGALLPEPYNVNVSDPPTGADTLLTQYPNVFRSQNLPRTRAAGIHVNGLEMANSINDSGTWVGANPNSYVNPGDPTITYSLICAKEGTFLLNSEAAPVGPGHGITGGQLTAGLFGSVNVQPKGAEYYRSQVTNEDLYLATKYWIGRDGKTIITKEDATKKGTGVDATIGHPIVDWNAKKMDPNSGDSIYILRMLDDNNHLIHSDLTAIITGPNAGRFEYVYDEESPSFFNVPATPDRYQPFREFSIHYHEAATIVRPFTGLFNYSKELVGPANGLDGFSINYGTSAITPEIYANRIGVGPMHDCIDCAYEEFFLSSWAVGDPATVVDIPANAVTPTTDGAAEGFQVALQKQNGGAVPDPTITKGPKANKVVYPDDPSNVYHSYMRDHVKFRIHHGGAGVPHVHHQHAHQWLHSPNSDDGHYLDSQTINPGSSYSLEMTYNGSGNRNQTVGDQIFHCHFYPHFASGMWSLWRVHDVMELGTELDPDNLPVAGSRALPDGEMSRGAATPAIVPMPTLSMAPIPGKIKIENGQTVLMDDDHNPGYPYFIPGIAGKRAPHPPLDFAVDTLWTKGPRGTIIAKRDKATGEVIKGELDGGLPRHVISGGKIGYQAQNNFDWTKIASVYDAIVLPEDGTLGEKLAMEAHATRSHASIVQPSLKDTGKPRFGNFTLNGLPPAHGAPFADPAIDDYGNSVGTKRVYKAAVIQTDAVLNRQGWHYPQQRVITTWSDVASTIDGTRPPEPFFFRANTDEYVEFWHTLLTPEYYELDDYQVRTPTDVIGQHIHLVKFDVTASDGAANGFNYEDGTFSPELVQERIKAINKGKRYEYPEDGHGMVGKYSIADIPNFITPATTKDSLKLKYPNPLWGKNNFDVMVGEGRTHGWMGAQTTIQRWYADPLLNNKGEERTLRTVFTHDHFSPSTHQQVGLYAGLLVEPEGSKWYLGKAPALTEKYQMGIHSDGSPTSWQANIVTRNQENSYREFAFEFQDTQLGYTGNSRGKLSPYPEYTGQDSATFSQLVEQQYLGWLSPTDLAGNGIYPNATTNINEVTSKQVSIGAESTYSVNYRNEPIPLRVSKATVAKGTGGARDTIKYAQASGIQGDLSHAYSSLVDRSGNSPVYRAQPRGGSLIPGSKTFKFPQNPISAGMQASDPYTPLLRAYAGDKVQIRTLVGAHRIEHMFNLHGLRWYFEPSEENSGFRASQMMGISEHFEMIFHLPPTQSSSTANPFRDYLYQTSAEDNGVQAGMWGFLRSYNNDSGNTQPDLARLPNNTAKKNDNRSVGCPGKRIDKSFTVYAVTPSAPISLNTANNATIPNPMIFSLQESPSVDTIQPLVLRANAGDCIQITVVNKMNAASVAANARGLKLDADNTNVKIEASPSVGLHTQMLSYDVGTSDGAAIGFNDGQLAASNGSTTYTLYAGIWEKDDEGNMVAKPAEFGTVVLSASDPLEQEPAGLFGTLVIEPEGTTWKTDEGNMTSATIFDADGSVLFREFVLSIQDQIATAGDNATSMAFNFRQEPLVNRFHDPNHFPNGTVVDSMVSNTLVLRDPYTPVFSAKAGVPTRFRLMHPRGTGDGQTLLIYGHNWQEEPYQEGSTKIGYNPKSQSIGSRGQIAAINSFDAVIDKAGGSNEVAGDYLLRAFRNGDLQNGGWGIFRVSNAPANATLTHVSGQGSNVVGVRGTLTPISAAVGSMRGNAYFGQFPDAVKIQFSTNSGRTWGKAVDATIASLTSAASMPGRKTWAVADGSSIGGVSNQVKISTYYQGKLVSTHVIKSLTPYLEEVQSIPASAQLMLSTPTKKKKAAKRKLTDAQKQRIKEQREFDSQTVRSGRTPWKKTQKK